MKTFIRFYSFQNVASAVEILQKKFPKVMFDVRNGKINADIPSSFLPYVDKEVYELDGKIEEDREEDER